MKKFIIISLAAFAALNLSACGSSGSQVDQVMAARMEEGKETESSSETTSAKAEDPTTTAAPTAPVTEPAPAESETEAKNTDGIDIDLTDMSGTMVYAEVYNMMVYPEEYIGKTVKIKGPYYAAYLEDRDAYYHYIIITDALACCESGIEIVWDNREHVYPDEYPADMTEIEVVGVFNTYEEDGYLYGCLEIDDLVFE